MKTEHLTHYHPLPQFMILMEEKLMRNNHKGGWHDCTISSLLLRAQQELGEVKTALAKGRPLVEVQLECADVANFMMMISDNLERQMEDQEAASHVGPEGEAK